MLRQSMCVHGHGRKLFQYPDICCFCMSLHKCIKALEVGSRANGLQALFINIFILKSLFEKGKLIVSDGSDHIS